MQASVILGAGPAGTGSLLWAARTDRLDSWLAQGVTLVDRAPAMGGTIGRYVVNSDSLGTSYLECLDPPAMRERFAPVCGSRVFRDLDRLRHGLPHLSLVGRFLELLSGGLGAIVARHGASQIRLGSTVRCLRLRPDGSASAEIETAGGGRSAIVARTAVMALGGRQHPRRFLDADLGGGVRLGETARGRIVPSDEILTASGLRRAATMLRQAENRRVVVLGGSHSAFSVACVLLDRLASLGFAPGDILLIHRTPPRIFYASREDALADFYPAPDEDICPATRRVNRLGGIRGDGRALWRRLTGRPGSEPEPRVRLMALAEPGLAGPALRRLLEDAALVVPAFGYGAATVPVLDPAGRRLPLMADRGGPSVGADARLLLADGSPLPSVFGVGLGSGYRPSGDMGGEASFRGQQNSLWLYQHDLGRIIFEGVDGCLREARRGVRTAPRQRLLPQVEEGFGRAPAAQPA